jgi:hypothetical protein
MDVAQVQALAAELETTLGLTAELVAAVRVLPAGSAPPSVVTLAERLAVRPALTDLPSMMLRAHAEISDILSGIRVTREAIQAHSVDRIRESKNRLSDVSASTESSTLELMNGLDRSLELINSLETQAKGQADSGGFDALRTQVSELYNHLQFQDITTQQLQGIGASLLEIEVRMSAVSAMFDHGVMATNSALRTTAPEPESSAGLAYNPDAKMTHSRADQAMIDAAFQGARRGTPASPAAS